MQPNKRNTRTIVIILVALALVGILVYVFSLSRRQANKPAPQTVSHYDAASHETVRTIPGEKTQTGEPAGYPVFLGMATLANYGLSSDQLTNMKDAFYQYSLMHSLNIKQVSIAVDTIHSSMENQGQANERSVIDCNVVFDGKTTEKATLYYSGLSDMELVLADPQSNAQLYDSGNIAATH